MGVLYIEKLISPKEPPGLCPQTTGGVPEAPGISCQTEVSLFCWGLGHQAA